MISMKVAKDLLQGKYTKDASPFMQYTGYGYVINKAGIDALHEQGLRLIQYKGMGGQRGKIIRFLGREALPALLASEEEEIREAAKKRLTEINEGYVVALIEATSKLPITEKGEHLLKIPVATKVQMEPVAYNPQLDSFIFELPNSTPVSQTFDIMHAVEVGDVETVKNLLPDTNVTIRDDALTYVATREHVAIARLLLSTGTTALGRDMALATAVGAGQSDMVKELLEHGANGATIGAGILSLVQIYGSKKAKYKEIAELLEEAGVDASRAIHQL